MHACSTCHRRTASSYSSSWSGVRVHCSSENSASLRANAHHAQRVTARFAIPPAHRYHCLHRLISHAALPFLQKDVMPSPVENTNYSTYWKPKDELSYPVYQRTLRRPEQDCPLKGPIDSRT